MNSSATFKFRLYVAGNTQNSVLARANLTRICQTHLPEQHQIEIVDVLREPRRGLADGVFMTPTLLKLFPSPEKKIIGTLSQTERVLQVLELEHSCHGL
ncbi:MAG TPA: circadian clock KaiB family protein [Roseimicrobium sp.]|nr:circadian clock KaiB family protein [Roseimicrobium sp.]